MKDQVVMSKTNGNLAVAIPLYRITDCADFAQIEGYSLLLTNERPLAYAVDCGEAGIQLMNAEIVEKHLHFLGELGEDE